MRFGTRKKKKKKKKKSAFIRDFLPSRSITIIIIDCNSS
tara:strand:+ start:128 stop:244 length:117 start_codon:yes stop_codon:yes gene_type:complete